MQYSQIIWATLYGFLFFNESPAQHVYVGAGIIILSGLYIVFREGRSKTSENRPVLTTMDLARDKGTRPAAGLLARLRAAAR